ncbi:hypothetical protein [Kribbella sp.]|nr:hypothetical protein [Kribbella sp.]HZX02844.1 hypothetical protein [Kribbella sp.]
MTKVRSEADEYRQGAEWPLGGTNGRRITPYELLLMTAGTQKLVSW